VIADAEAKLRVTFHPDLRDYLKLFGHLEIADLELFGLGENTPPFLDLIRMTLSERTESECPPPPGLIPLCNDGGGNLYCISVATGTGTNASGAIILWEHDGGPDQELEVTADCLETWLLETVRERE
jgi:cell wall assembly regulator SMI1